VNRSLKERADSLVDLLSASITRIRRILGLTGLVERVHVAAEEGRSNMIRNPYELLQAGLLAERQQCDVERAAGLYERALEQTADDALLHQQLSRCLARARTSLPGPHQRP
jgi:hypothetical protein